MPANNRYSRLEDVARHLISRHDLPTPKLIRETVNELRSVLCLSVSDADAERLIKSIEERLKPLFEESDFEEESESTPEQIAEDDRNWRFEQAMEAGMLHGIDAYNDTMESD